MYIGKSRIVSASDADAYYSHQIKETIRLGKFLVILGLIGTSFYIFQDLTKIYILSLLLVRMILVGTLIGYGIYLFFVNEKKNRTLEWLHTFILVCFVVTSVIQIIYTYMIQGPYHPHTQLALEAYIVDMFFVFLFSGVGSKWLHVICLVPYLVLVGFIAILTQSTFTDLFVYFTNTSLITFLVVFLAYKKEGDSFNTFIAKLKLQQELSINAKITEALKLTLEENEKLNKNLEYLAMTDTLTGTYPRSAGIEIINKEIKHCKRLGTQMSLIFIDVDGLKNVNDTHGHAQGDKFLQIIIENFKQRVRTTDHIVRMGGDEFLIALPQCDLSNASELIEQVKLSLEKCTIMTVKPTFSYGITLYDPESSITLNELIEEADLLMYQDKFTKSMQVLM